MIKRFTTSTGIFNVLNTDEAFFRCFSNGDTWEKDLLDKVLQYIPDSGTILDIGGHIGTHAIPYSLARPNARVITFEPQRKIREILESNKVVNNAHNLSVMSYGVGHANTWVHLANDFTSDGYSKDIKVNYSGHHNVNFGGIGITNDLQGEQIELRTVDSMDFKDVTYMKIDVEGAETLVVYGARDTIQKYRPNLLIEQSDKNLVSLYTDHTTELKTFDSVAFLHSLGYTRTDLGNCNYFYTLAKHGQSCN